MAQKLDMKTRSGGLYVQLKRFWRKKKFIELHNIMEENQCEEAEVMFDINLLLQVPMNKRRTII